MGDEHLRPFRAGRRWDRFQLLRELGRGSFGSVWLALDEGFGTFGFRKYVALKLVPAQAAGTRSDALAHEARICGHLNHPNIVDVHGVIESHGTVGVVMAFIQGETLAELWADLRSVGLRLPRSIIVELGIALCEALHHAWTTPDLRGEPLRIVHRDLKPTNIMISDRGVAKITDFGIAKAAADTRTTLKGELKGTPAYMAPEVWRGKRSREPAVDLWSVGVILWELATGERLFARKRPLEVYELFEQRSPAEEAAAVAPYMPALEPLLLRLLQRDPDERFDDAFSLGLCLREVRMAQGAAPDLLQFRRLVHASRVPASDRHPSIAELPALPADLDDWLPLLELASRDDDRSSEPAVRCEEVAGPQGTLPSGNRQGALLAPGGPPVRPSGEPSWQDEPGASESLEFVLAED